MPGLVAFIPGGLVLSPAVRSTGRRLCGVLLTSGAVLASGCAQTTGPSRLSSLRSVPAEEALALPPPGGPAVIDIVERRFSNATQQDIALATNSTAPGQNTLRVQFFGPVDSSNAGNTRLSDSSIHPADIASEMRSQLPGIAMTRSPYYVQNRYGPFGYAVGRYGSNDLCLYAWQRVRAPAASTTLIANRGTIQLRLRLCETGATEEKLLSTMYGFSVTASVDGGSWSPYGPPPSPGTGFAQPGHAVYPAGTAGFETVAEPVASAPASAPRWPQPKPSAPENSQVPDASALPAPVGPTVPLPPAEASTAGHLTVPPPPCSTQSGKQDVSCN